MFYQSTLENQSHQTPTRLPEGLSFYRIIESSHQRLIQQKLLFQKIFTEQRKKRSEAKFKSKNSIWDTVKLIKRFNKSEYRSKQSKVDLLKFDADHFAREIALIETVTRFSYWHNVSKNETLGDGYSEDITLMLNTFTQELAEKGLNSSRANIETVSFQKAKNLLNNIAITGTNDAVLITSFPDSEEFGYHGVDSKHNLDKPETHHSFFYLLRVGDIKKDQNGQITDFEIKTTQYRAWPNARQALKLHEQLGQPITNLDEPVPNLLFANLIQLNQSQLEGISQKLNIEKNNLSPKDSLEDDFEELFKQIIYNDSENHAINFTQVPEVNQEEFWEIQQQYFDNFYLEIALPVFEEINQIKLKTKKLDKKTVKEIQQKIDYLDKAFFYYSKIIMGWIKINNTNPNYTNAFKEKNQVKKLMNFQQKLLLRLLGQKQNKQLPSVQDLKIVLDIDHRLATRQKVSADEKKKLLSVWGFFSFVGNFSSLLQCGTLAPFTAPISIMKGYSAISTVGSLNKAASLAEFTSSISSISVPEKQAFLKALQSEKYVELDLTKNKPPAKKVYTVPESYLEGLGCTVNKDGDVLGPCIDPEDDKRIPLDDPRDTLAFPMNLAEFNQYILALQKNIEQNTLSELDNIFQSPDFSSQEQRNAQTTIKKLRQKLIKQSLSLQDFFTGDLTNQEFSSNNEWLKELIIKLSFSLNPVETLVTEVKIKLEEKDPILEQLTESKN